MDTFTVNKIKNKEDVFIFSYGSNMSNGELLKYNKKINNNKNILFEVIDIGCISNYEFKYMPLYTKSSNKKLKTAKATIIPANNNKRSKVYGTITKVSSELFKALVKKEGVYKKYYKTQTKSITSCYTKNKYKCVMFVMTDQYLNRTPTLDIHPSVKPHPSKRYENLILEAALHYNFPNNYIKKYLTHSKSQN